MANGLFNRIDDIFSKSDSGRGDSVNTLDAQERSLNRRESRFNLNNKLPFSKRQSDPSQNYFVYGLQQKKFVPRTPDGVRMTELEDPTYHSFDLEIVTNESPLFKQVWCFTDKYQLHPEMKDRHELYVLFMKVLSYYINSDETPSADRSSVGSESPTKVEDDSPQNNQNEDDSVRRGATSTASSPTRGEFSGNRLTHTERNIRVDAQDLYTQESTVAVKKHYITKVSGLDSLHQVPAHNRNYPGDYENKEVTIHVREDVVQWTKLLTKLYNDLCYSVHNQRAIMPNNLMEFTLRIKVSEVRNLARVQSALQQFNNAIRFDFRELLLNPVLQRAGRHWGTIEQVYDKELSAVRALTEDLAFHRYTLYGCRFKYPMEYGLSDVNNGGPAIYEGSTLKLTYKRGYEEYVSDVVPSFTTRGPKILHLDNNDELLVRTGGLRTGSSTPSNETERAYARGRTRGSQLSTGQTNTAEDIFNNFPGLAGAGETAAESLVAFKDQMVANVASDVREQLGVTPILPENIYRPGDLLQQVVQQAASRGFNDLTEILTG